MMSEEVKDQNWDIPIEDIGGQDDRLKGIDDYDLRKQEAIRYKEDTIHRKTLVKWMMIVVSIWLGGVLLITASSYWLKISPSVIMTLLATTTANVLGLAHIILKGLFRGSKPMVKNNKTRHNN